MLVDWEWATLAPPEWDVSLATWSIGSIHDEDAVKAFLDGYGGNMSRSRLESWTAYHAAMRLLEAAESRDGRLADLASTVDALAQAVGART
jgi:thiamine kinase-like enzyme